MNYAVDRQETAPACHMIQTSGVAVFCTVSGIVF